jgi:hypothetical protein
MAARCEGAVSIRLVMKHLALEDKADAINFNRTLQHTATVFLSTQFIFLPKIPVHTIKYNAHRATASRPSLRFNQPPIQWVPESLSLVVKRPELEANHSPPSSAKVKNAWSHTSTPQCVFMAWCSLKHRDNLTFTFIGLGCKELYHTTILQRHALSENEFL